MKQINLTLDNFEDYNLNQFYFVHGDGQGDTYIIPLEELIDKWLSDEDKIIYNMNPVALFLDIFELINTCGNMSQWLYAKDNEIYEVSLGDL